MDKQRKSKIRHDIKNLSLRLGVMLDLLFEGEELPKEIDADLKETLQELEELWLEYRSIS